MMVSSASRISVTARPVLPIALYNGSSRWTAATDVTDLIPRAPGLVVRHLPRLKYLLIDENQFSSIDVGRARNRMAAIIQVERSASEQALISNLPFSQWSSCFSEKVEYPVRRG